MIEIIKENACAVTGHRNLKTDLSLLLLKNTFIHLIKGGKDTFLVGMALGFDTVCFKVLEELRKEYGIRIIACIPCLEQAKYFSLKDKKEYDRMLSVADDKKVISENYNGYCMIKRNKFMVDNSSVLVAYLRENNGGTFRTVEYAKEKNKLIYYI